MLGGTQTWVKTGQTGQEAVQKEVYKIASQVSSSRISGPE